MTEDQWKRMVQKEAAALAELSNLPDIKASMRQVHIDVLSEFVSRLESFHPDVKRAIMQELAERASGIGDSMDALDTMVKTTRLVTKY